MRRYFTSISSMAVGFCLLCAGAAQAQLSEGWPGNAFIKPLPSASSGGKPQSASKTKTVSALKEFLRGGVFLRKSDVTNYSKSLESLVGNYFFYEGKGREIQLVGTTVESTDKKIDIKDGVVLKAIVDRRLNAGGQLPVFLKLDLKSQDLAELEIRSLASVHGNTDTNLANCNYPISYLARPKVKMYYITAATVSSVNKRIYKKRKQSASLLVSILSINGGNYYSDDFVQRTPVISVSFIPARPVPPDYIHLCSKYNDAYAAVQAGVLKRSAPQFNYLSGMLRSGVNAERTRTRSMNKQHNTDHLLGKVVGIKAQ